jgi:hypothetical protein
MFIWELDSDTDCTFPCNLNFWSQMDWNHSWISNWYCLGNQKFMRLRIVNKYVLCSLLLGFRSSNIRLKLWRHLLQSSLLQLLVDCISLLLGLNFQLSFYHCKLWKSALGKLFVLLGLNRIRLYSFKEQHSRNKIQP